MFYSIFTSSEGMNLAQSKINELIEQVLSEEGLTSKELVIAGFRFEWFLNYNQLEIKFFSKFTLFIAWRAVLR